MTLISISDFFNAALNRFYDRLEEKIEEDDQSTSVNAETKEFNILNLPDILHGLSNPGSSSTSSRPELDGDGIKRLLDIQKRSKSDAKRTQDMSRVAMRILKRSGQDTSRVAMRILKKRGRNAARIAMRVLRKRDGENPQTYNQLKGHQIYRVSRASPYSNIGGYFGGMGSVLPPHLGLGLPKTSHYFYALPYHTEKRDDSTPDSDYDNRTNSEDEN